MIPMLHTEVSGASLPDPASTFVYCLTSEDMLDLEKSLTSMAMFTERFPSL